ncbi:type IV pili methyl-accepting chemotaxis transducer N-terminal domain-containing protein [Simplicispira psychrophila]|uniref:type IV pili methyl-accepting chemotaxis transducer N-terminal domain-containing protein n=1 Tax=Simplicispira psychrophila TaxID=80882 RepID=UPI000AE39E61|nr:type IV pili methyl-accepting chemotaxis transducer N-terminal domain-containing protein [Simplicispira psychrophila]
MAAALLVPTWQTAQAQLVLSTAINRTARFRALSQRMAKAYCQIHLNVLPEQARTVLVTARQLVHSGFADLAQAQWPQDLAEQLAQVQKLALGLEALLDQPPSKEAVAAVSVQADKMLASADNATQTLEKLSKTSTARLVITAGRQRMLSQRLAKNYSLAAAGFNNQAVANQMISDATEFKQALVILGAASISSAGIRNELGLGASQWIFFDAALQRQPDMRGLQAVATTSERLLEVMDKLTGLYDVALKEELG